MSNTRYVRSLVPVNRFYQPIPMMSQDEDQQMQQLMNNINGAV